MLCWFQIADLVKYSKHVHTSRLIVTILPRVCRVSVHTTLAWCRYVGPAQQRYGEYFCGVLFNPTLRPPSEITKMLRRIVFSPFDFITLAAADPTVDGVWDNDDPAPFLVLYQHGKSVWAGPSETQA